MLIKGSPRVLITKPFYSQAYVCAKHERKHHQSQGDMLWQRNSSAVRNSLGLPRRSEPWSSVSAMSLKGVTKCPRQYDLVNTAWEARLKEGGGRYSAEELSQGFWVDVSQTVLRKPWGSRLRPFRGRGHLFAFQAGRCIDGNDLMRLLGWPPVFLEAVPAGDMLNLAAESSCVPFTTLLCVCLWCNPRCDWHASVG